MSAEDLQAIAMEPLYRHLEGAGLRPTRTPERILLGLDGLSAWCRVDPPDQHPDVCVLPMWFVTTLPSGQVVEESIAGIGESPSHAAAKGAHAWSEGVLPVLREVYDPDYKGEGCRFEMASLNQQTQRALQWEVFAGPFQFMGEPDGALLERLESPPPFTLVMDAVSRPLHDPSPHWVKLLLHRINGKVDGEVRIDNELSRDGLRQLSRFKWPPGSGFQNFRQFLFLRNREVSPEEARAEYDCLTAEAARQQAEKRRWWEYWKR